VWGGFGIKDEIMELEGYGLQTAISLRISLRIPSISFREHALPFRRTCDPRERELCRVGGRKCTE